jgi:hypothetical protein
MLNITNQITSTTVLSTPHGSVIIRNSGTGLFTAEWKGLMAVSDSPQDALRRMERTMINEINIERENY